MCRLALAVIAAAACVLSVVASATAAPKVRNGDIFLTLWQEPSVFSVWQGDPGSPFQRMRGATTSGGVPCVSPDGRRLAYVSWPRAVILTRHIFANNRVGRGRMIGRLPFGRDDGDGDCAWSPHGGSIVITGDDESRDGRNGVWKIHRDGTRLHKILATESIPADPVWSTSGRIAFTNADDTSTAVVNADGTDLTVMNGFHGQRPAWSADGRALAFVRGPEWFVAGPLWAATADGLQLQSLRRGFVEAAAFSPDGRKLAIARLAEERHGNHHEEVMVARPDGTRAQIVLRMPNTLPWYAIGLTWARKTPAL